MLHIYTETMQLATCWTDTHSGEPDKGCRDTQVIAERKAREFANRSAGQKRRWAKSSNAGGEATGAALCDRSPRP